MTMIVALTSPLTAGFDIARIDHFDGVDFLSSLLPSLYSKYLERQAGPAEKTPELRLLTSLLLGLPGIAVLCFHALGQL
jgi:hypothetical protein